MGEGENLADSVFLKIRHEVVERATFCVWVLVARPAGGCSKVEAPGIGGELDTGAWGWTARKTPTGLRCALVSDRRERRATGHPDGWKASEKAGSNCACFRAVSERLKKAFLQ
jgi:hypothetical protein